MDVQVYICQFSFLLHMSILIFNSHFKQCQFLFFVLFSDMYGPMSVFRVSYSDSECLIFEFVLRLRVSVFRVRTQTQSDCFFEFRTQTQSDCFFEFRTQTQSV